MHSQELVWCTHFLRWYPWRWAHLLQSLVIKRRNTNECFFYFMTLSSFCLPTLRLRKMINSEILIVSPKSTWKLKFGARHPERISSSLCAPPVLVPAESLCLFALCPPPSRSHTLPWPAVRNRKGRPRPRVSRLMKGSKAKGPQLWYWESKQTPVTFTISHKHGNTCSRANSQFH